MHRMFSLWMLIGIAVACCWVGAGILTGPNHNLGHSTFVAISAPAAVLGRRMRLGVLWFVLLNGFIYALIGIVIELLRKAIPKSVNA